MTIEQDIEHAAELATRLANLCEQRDHDGRNLPDRIVLAKNGHPRAASYTPSEPALREPEAGVPEWPEGIPGPSRSDPTGEAGIRPDRAAADHHTFAKAIRAARVELDKAARVASRYVTRSATDKERREMEEANTDKPGCYTHAKAGLWAQADRAGQCDACYRFENRVGRPPSIAEVTQYEDRGKFPRVKVTA